MTRARNEPSEPPDDLHATYPGTRLDTPYPTDPIYYTLRRNHPFLSTGGVGRKDYLSYFPCRTGRNAPFECLSGFSRLTKCIGNHDFIAVIHGGASLWERTTVPSAVAQSTYYSLTALSLLTRFFSVDRTSIIRYLSVLDVFVRMYRHDASIEAITFNIPNHAFIPIGVR